MLGRCSFSQEVVRVGEEVSSGFVADSHMGWLDVTYSKHCPAQFKLANMNEIIQEKALKNLSSEEISLIPSFAMNKKFITDAIDNRSYEQYEKNVRIKCLEI